MPWSRILIMSSEWDNFICINIVHRLTILFARGFCQPGIFIPLMKKKKPNPKNKPYQKNRHILSVLLERKKSGKSIQWPNHWLSLSSKKHQLKAAEQRQAVGKRDAEPVFKNKNNTNVPRKWNTVIKKMRSTNNTRKVKERKSPLQEDPQPHTEKP